MTARRSACAPAPPITAAELRALLEVRYCVPEWRLESEVTYRGRRLDVVALRMWGGSGKGHLVLGFELKISRADWLRELKALEKAEDWTAVVDQFFVVAPRDVVQVEELPKGWGLLEVRGTGLRVRAHAPPATAAETLPREITARLIDRVNLQLRAKERDVEKRIRPEIVASVRAEYERRAERTTAHLTEDAEKWRALLEELNRLGVPSWKPPAEQVAAAARVLTALGKLPAHWQLEAPVRTVGDLASSIQRSVHELYDATATFRALRDAAQEAARAVPNTSPAPT